MANVKFPRKEFEKEINLDKKTIEKISLFGTPLESLTNTEIEIEIFPNRPDLLPMHGFIRSFKSFLGKSKGIKHYKLNKPEKNYKVKIDQSVKKIRPWTVCAIVKNLSFNNERIREIIDLQEKLHNTLGRKRKKVAIGIYPLEKISLPITYKALSPDKIKFIPLESEKEMTGTQILKKHPAGKEYSHLLENLEKYPVFSDSEGKILSMPPIINGHETGKITEQTKSIFVECSGHDFTTLSKTLNIIITTLADIGGSIYQMELDYGRKTATPDLNTEKISVSLNNVNKLLGIELREQDLQGLLHKMGLDYSKGKAEIPSWRSDILHEVDIIEDIAIAYGYENLTPKIPNISTTASESKESRLKLKISEILTGLNLIEISSYHLVKPEEIKTNSENYIKLLDSKTEYKFLRQNLLIPALRILSENKDAEYPQRIFEIGASFSKSPEEETGIKETENLMISLSPSNFTEAKQVLDCLFRTLNLNYNLEETSKKELIEGRTGVIVFKNKHIGYIGEVHPRKLREWNIKMPLSVIEISLEEILKSI